ncbi:MAG: hypothetical protein R8J94_01895 [Acidimicrobiia bacterium]|nr:hypothetical protein [Acidimicrobiia bacterium]
MHWFGGASYITAAVISLANGQHPMLAFIAAALTAWLAIAVYVETRSTTPEVATTNGWTGSHSIRAVETINAIRQLAFFAALMRLALVFFSFLLVTWTLLP